MENVTVKQPTHIARPPVHQNPSSYWEDFSHVGSDAQVPKGTQKTTFQDIEVRSTPNTSTSEVENSSRPQMPPALKIRKNKFRKPTQWRMDMCITQCVLPNQD